MTEIKCPVGRDKCPCPEYSKEGLCDYPYKKGMTINQVKEIRGNDRK